MASSTAVRQRKRGGEFLIAPSAPEEIFTPEDFTDEHKAVAKTTEDFYWNEVAPHAEAMLKEPVAAVPVLRKAAELGLTGVAVPERYGGMEMDLISAMIVAEHLSKNGSYGVWHSAHSGIGTMPLLLFGNEEQKQKYLPRLVSGEMVAAYALTEPHAGSDVQAIKTRAELDAGGQNYRLNGQKMWISNAAGAGLFTVFAKVDGEKFTAFLVERASEGLAIGAEEKKMGIQGSSTCAVYFDNVSVPVENVLGEVGGGLRIAFNCLNLGRLKLGAGVLGAAKHALAVTLKYAKERHAFGKPIAEFGLIRQKLAELAIRIFAAETMTYRVAGAIDDWLRDVSWDQPEAPALHLNAFEEFAAECAMVKIFATETLDYVVDEGVQIHGGYGFHQDYEIECAYRDSRINRIFEGTNEINRLLATGMLLKRAQRGRLALPEAVKALEAELLNPPAAVATGDPAALAANAKKAALLALGVAFRRFHTELDRQQEVLAGITDLATEALAIESMALRSRRLDGASGAAEMCRLYTQEAMERVEATGRAVLAVYSQGDALRVSLAILKRLTRCEPVDGFAGRRRIAGRLIEAQRYVV